MLKERRRPERRGAYPYGDRPMRKEILDEWKRSDGTIHASVTLNAYQVFSGWSTPTSLVTAAIPRRYCGWRSALRFQCGSYCRITNLWLQRSFNASCIFKHEASARVECWIAYCFGSSDQDPPPTSACFSTYAKAMAMAHCPCRLLCDSHPKHWSCEPDRWSRSEHRQPPLLARAGLGTEPRETNHPWARTKLLLL